MYKGMSENGKGIPNKGRIKEVRELSLSELPQSQRHMRISDGVICIDKEW